MAGNPASRRAHVIDETTIQNVPYIPISHLMQYAHIRSIKMNWPAAKATLPSTVFCDFGQWKRPYFEPTTADKLSPTPTVATPAK
uniref:Uncharacterized protein n=1 Tax=Setaria digitata TaxID=48799 RepID=A0A915PZC3_9BILA